MSWAEIFVIIKSVIFSWYVLGIILAVSIFLALVFYVANHNKDVLDYSIPMNKVKKIKKKK